MNKEYCNRLLGFAPIQHSEFLIQHYIKRLGIALIQHSEFLIQH